MKPFLTIFLRCAFAAILVVTSSAATKLDISRLTSVPEGNYLVTLELNGKTERLNVKVQNERAKCVNSSDAALKGMEGVFRRHPQQQGVFIVSFRSPRGAMTQIWIFRPDGAAAIRENPDRGEQQSAVPVSGDSIKPRD